MKYLFDLDSDIIDSRSTFRYGDTVLVSGDLASHALRVCRSAKVKNRKVLGVVMDSYDSGVLVQIGGIMIVQVDKKYLKRI